MVFFSIDQSQKPSPSAWLRRVLIQLNEQIPVEKFHSGDSSKLFAEGAEQEGVGCMETICASLIEKLVILLDLHSDVSEVFEWYVVDGLWETGFTD